jgi:hypothetical protein
MDLNMQLKSQATPDMKAKRRECKEAEEELKQIEARLGECMLEIVHHKFLHFTLVAISIILRDLSC